MKTGDLIYFVAVAAGIAYNFYAKSKKKQKSDWEDILPAKPAEQQERQKQTFTQTVKEPIKKAPKQTTSMLFKEGESIFDVARKEEAAVAKRKLPLNNPKNRKTSNFLRKAVVYDTILNRPNY